MKIDEFCKWPFIHDPVINPRGDELIFSLTRANLEKNKYETNLWTCRRKDYQAGTSEKIYNDLAGQTSAENEFEIRPLTSGGTDSSVLFFPCGKKILFKSQRETQSSADKSSPHKENIFYELPLDGGEARALFSLNLNSSRAIFLDDKHLLISGYYDFAREADWTEVSGLPAWLNGAGYIDGIKSGLFLLDLDKAIASYKADKNKESGEDLASKDGNDNKSDRTGDLAKLLEEAKSFEKSTKSAMRALEEVDMKNGLTRLTPEDFSLSSWDRAGNFIYYSGTDSKDPLHLTQEVYLLENFNSRPAESKLLMKDISVWDILTIPESSSVYLVYTDMKKQGINENARIATLDPDGNLKAFTDPDADIDLANSLGSDARFQGGNYIKARKDGLYFIETQADRVFLMKAGLDGKIEEVVNEQVSVESFDLPADGSADDPIFYLAMDQALSEIYIKDNAGCRKISNFNKELTAKLIRPRSLIFESNGDDIRGFVIPAKGYDPDKDQAKTYPALLWIHGGPKTILGPALYHEMQYFANEGYFVFYTNPHGSSGRGDAFSNIRASYGSKDYQDLMTFADRVLEEYPAIDDKRLGVLGGSYGGFMTNWIISHTDRFAAANSQRSISNWISFYGVSDIGYYFSPDQTFADPKALTSSEAYLRKAWAQSPLKYADKITTPTLFIHSEEDYRCPLEQGLQMYTALKVRGIDSKIVIFKGENHELSRSGRPKSRLKRLFEIKAWFDKYLMK